MTLGGDLEAIVGMFYGRLRPALMTREHSGAEPGLPLAPPASQKNMKLKLLLLLIGRDQSPSDAARAQCAGRVVELLVGRRHLPPCLRKEGALLGLLTKLQEKPYVQDTVCLLQSHEDQE